MDLLNALVNATGSGDLQKLGAQFGLDEEAVGNILGQVVPALGDGLKKNAASSGGLDSLVGALQNGNHQRYLGNIDSATSSMGVSDGNNILGHILGSYAYASDAGVYAVTQRKIDDAMFASEWHCGLGPFVR